MEKLGKPVTFEHARGTLERLEIHFWVHRDCRGEIGERYWVDLPFFKGLALPFSPIEWCDLCMREGAHYVGGCCGQMSTVQDLVNSFFRDSGSVSDLSYLEQVATACASHDGFEKFNRVCLDEETPLDFKSYDPWDKMAVIWEVVKDHWKPAKLESKPSHFTELDRSIRVLSNGLTFLPLRHLFNEDKPLTGPQVASDIRQLSRLIPAIKVVHEQLHTLAPPDFEGVALVKKSEPDNVLSNGYGYCIYLNEEEAQEIINSWRKWEENHEDPPRDGPVDERVAIRSVKVSLEKGLEFLGEARPC